MLKMSMQKKDENEAKKKKTDEKEKRKRRRKMVTVGIWVVLGYVLDISRIGEVGKLKRVYDHPGVLVFTVS